MKHKNSIYSSDLDIPKIGFIIEPIKRHYAQSTYQKIVTFSYSDVAEASITKQ